MICKFCVHKNHIGQHCCDFFLNVKADNLFKIPFRFYVKQTTGQKKRWKKKKNENLAKKMSKNTTLAFVVQIFFIVVQCPHCFMKKPWCQKKGNERKYCVFDINSNSISLVKYFLTDTRHIPATFFTLFLSLALCLCENKSNKRFPAYFPDENAQRQPTSDTDLWPVLCCACCFFVFVLEILRTDKTVFSNHISL